MFTKVLFGKTSLMDPTILTLGDKTKLCCVLLSNVKNCVDLKNLVMSGELQCTIINPKYILDLFQVSVAANKALQSDSHKKLNTKSLYTEVLFNLSITRNISQSLVKFGIDDKCSEILILTIGEEEQAKTSLRSALSKVDGTQIDIDELRSLVDITSVRKLYKINENESNVSTLLDLLVSKIATKDFVNH